MTTTARSLGNDIKPLIDRVVLALETDGFIASESEDDAS